MIRLPHIVECVLEFNLLCDQGQHRRLLNLQKQWSFSCLSSYLDHFSQVFGQDKE